MYEANDFLESYVANQFPHENIVREENILNSVTHSRLASIRDHQSTSHLSFAISLLPRI